MKKIIFIFTFIIASCVSLNNSYFLYNKFSEYSNGANSNNIFEVAGQFFSPSLLGKDYHHSSDAVDQLLFKDYMIHMHDHYEAINGKEGCLAINGYDEDKNPLVFSIKYIKYKNIWLIDDVHVLFIDNSSDFVHAVKCPSEFVN